MKPGSTYMLRCAGTTIDADLGCIVQESFRKGPTNLKYSLKCTQE